MKFLPVLLAVLASASFAGAQNVQCKAGDSDTTITVNNKAKLTFVVPKKTPHNMDCAANYVLGTCSRVNIKCTFKMKAKGATCVGDKALITVGGKTTTLCNRKGRYANKKVTGDFSIQVMTDGKKVSKGGKCNIKCTKKGKPKPTTPAPTPPPTTGGSCTCSCGVVQRATRIVGGVETEVSEYPWQAGLVDKGSSTVWCGGSLLNSKWVLTAAHCTDTVTANQIQVLLGEHNYDTAGETDMQRMNVGQIKNHPDYNDVTTNNDFALLRLKKAVDFCTHSHIRPICLPTDTSESFAGVDAIVTGWGTTSSGGSLSSSMLEVTLKVLTNNQCKNDYSYASSMITSKMLCANVDGGGKDSCQGDSGGPLVTAGSNNNYLQIGVVSWGYGCALASAPGVYARVTAQLSWINEILSKDGQSCPPNV